MFSLQSYFKSKLICKIQLIELTLRTLLCISIAPESVIAFIHFNYVQFKCGIQFYMITGELLKLIRNIDRNFMSM